MSADAQRTVNFRCANCGHYVVVLATSVVVTVVVYDGGRIRCLTFVECPTCRHGRHDMIQDVRVSVLLEAGSRHVRALIHNESFPLLPPFTPDDLIDFHFILEDDANIEEVIAEWTPRSTSAS